MVISLYSGVWRAQIERLDSEFTKAAHLSTLVRNECWRATKFYSCAQTVNGKQGALVVYTWNGKTRAYCAYAIPSDGGSPHKSTLLIDGDDWFFPWDQKKAGSVIHFRLVNHFIGRDTIEYRAEFSRDGANWTTLEQGIEQCQSG